MPKSRVRQKKVYTPPADVAPRVATISKRSAPSTRWVPGTALALIIFGIAWLVTFYLSQGEWPVMSWRYWNLGVGFGALVAALVVLARWH